MRWSLFSIVLLSGALFLRAETAEDAYLRIYTKLHEADGLKENGQQRSAAAKYFEAQTALKRFQQVFPKWNEKIVSYRLTYATEQMAALEKFLPAAAAQATSTESGGNSEPTPPANAVKTEQEMKIDGLTGEVLRLENEKSRLEAKLKEALTLQPAAVDPAQLASARWKIAELEKERDLLKVTAEQEQAKITKLDEANRIDPQMLKELENERDDLKQQLNVVTAARDQLEKRLQLAQAKAAASPEAGASSAELKKLQQEKKETETKFQALTQDFSELLVERGQEIKAHQEALKRIQQLEEEIDSLQLKLMEQKAASSNATTGSQPSPLAEEVEKLRARIAAYEAKAVPLTAEEQALLKQPEGSTASAQYLANRPTAKELPASAQKLVEEADAAFARHQFEVAAKKYKQVLEKNEDNVYTLANLASAQIELNQLQEAAGNLKRALTIEPKDPFSLLLLGKLKMNENKMDEAMNALSLAAELNPDNAETQNCLGIVLSEKGLRAAAEAALRKAIQLQPNYANAHHNLAIIYATQKPPFVELARWHYEKAVALGHAKNPELEKLVAGK